MKISQTQRGKALIEATLYKRQTWLPTGWVTKHPMGISLTSGATLFLNSVITVDFRKNVIKVDGRPQRMRRETSRDLIDIVRLKLTKKLKHV